MQSFNETPSEAEYSGSIRQLADRIRRLGIVANGEASFARMCLTFDFTLVPDQGYTAPEVGETDERNNRIDRLFQRLATHDIDAKFWQLSMVWLDGQGFGDMTLEQLGQAVKKTREKFLSA